MDKKIEAVLFDMDGVLIDSESKHVEVDNEALKPYGVTLTLEDWKESLGLRFRDFFEEVGKKFNINLPIEEFKQQHDLILEHYYQQVFPTIAFAKDVLQNLFQDEYNLGLITSREKRLAEIALRRHSLFDFFQTRVYGEDVKSGKPHPEPFLKGANNLQIQVDKIVAVEDSLNGFKSVKAAGMLLVALKASHNNHQDFSLADFVIEDLREIPDILKNIH